MFTFNLSDEMNFNIPKYEGYSNYPTYAVRLYINNNKLSYQYFKRVLKDTNDRDDVILKLKELD